MVVHVVVDKRGWMDDLVELRDGEAREIEEINKGLAIFSFHAESECVCIGGGGGRYNRGDKKGVKLENFRCFYNFLITKLILTKK